MKRRTALHHLSAGTAAVALSSFAPIVRAAASKEVRLDYAYYSPPNLVIRRFGWLEQAFANDGIGVKWVLSAGSNRALEYLSSDNIDIGSSAGLAAVLGRVYLGVSAGFRDVDRKLLEVAAVYGLSRVERIRRVLLPASLPSIFTGLRNGLSLAWMFMVAAELIAASKGLGYLLTDGRETGRADIVVAAIVLLALLGKVITRGSRSSSTKSGSRVSNARCRRSSPAARRSASRSPAACSASRDCCCSTSHSRPSTRSRGRICRRC